ncbi:MAG: hypothetical protein IPN42_15330 [Methylococcaceae bacterium]|nr:hypothetical protein [Methylococcaceae bacterium]
MKFKTVNTIISAFSLIVGLVATSTGQAAQVTGSLGSSLVSADTWTFTCPTGTIQSRIRIMDLNTTVNLNAIVYATFGEDGNPSLTVSDSESTSTGSAFATNTSDGPGNYSLLVRKSAINTDDYVAEAQCLDSSGAVIGPLRLVAQINQ